ncbi:YidB family protein [Aquabacterium sp.]|uniref:YidB family protein n=1 Tax=Aquabacterium sp. TaxID=1872578 RepID=UPI0035AF6987
MGFFDPIAGQVLNSLSGAGSNNGQQSALIEAIGGLLNNQQGGLAGLVSAFEQQGLGGIIGSWVGTGQNQAISADQLQSVLGNGQIQAMAEKLGLSPDALSGHLTELLPQVIDKLTPGGNVPEAGALGGLLDLLKGSAT